MKKSFIPFLILYTSAVSFIAGSYTIIAQYPKTLFFIVAAFIFINAFAGCLHMQKSSLRLKVCFHGAVLLTVFLASLTVMIPYHIFLASRLLPLQPFTFIFSALTCTLCEAVIFWNGIICVYLSSVQLGIKQRVIGIVCGMIPIANLIALGMILKTVFKEVRFEREKELLDLSRKNQRICATKYPIVMVHGVFFRDSKYFNYWGRIPSALTVNGAVIHYGNHQSAASVADAAAELCERIKAIVDELGCEKVNIIAHSKGGLDCRYAIEKLDLAPYAASLITINTPHRGCIFADHLLNIISEDTKNTAAEMYNSTLKKFGDESPDFLAAVNDLTASASKRMAFSDALPDGIYTESVGSVLSNASGGKFPLNFSYHLVKHFDGPTDGLVGESAFSWGEKYTLLKTDGRRGISHGDMIDLNRENIDGFDVREFYVQLVASLKKRGL